jgi:tetratricopeptide (TPR) repeat protein
VHDENGASLGSVALAVSCTPDAVLRVRRGLALLHNMTYAQAEQEFQAASELDEECVLAKWGEAMSLFHPLWPDVPPPEAFVRGRTLIEEARTSSTSKLEDAYLSALEAYYVGAEERSESERLQMYAAGWEAVVEAFPDDIEARLFNALSGIAVSGATGNRVEAQARTGQIAESVLDEVPDHPGALHYIIHSYDLPQLADRGLPAARIYGKVAPENSHALHMTSHIFTRVGSWEESIEYNTRAAASGLDNPVNGALSMHYLHAADYLVYAYLQRGEDEKALQIWDDLVGVEGPITNHAASAYAYAAVPARLALERQNWAAAKSLEIPQKSGIQWDQYPHLEAIVEFGQGMGAAHTGAPDDARNSVSRLNELEEMARALPGAYDWGSQVEVQKLALEAWIEFESGNEADALDIMKAASELEATTAKNPVTPGEVLPAAELLGDMLLALNRPKEAVTAYETALARTPNRLNSLYGAGRASELNGNVEAAEEYFSQLLAITDDDADLERIVYAKTVSEVD